MRKVLSFVLVLSLVLGSFSMAFAANEAGLSDIAGIANEDAIQVAYDLGIVTGNPDGTYLPEKAVNRAEFAALITRALAIPESALAGYTTTTFKDTVGYGWAVPYLAFCQSKGIMIGDGQGNAMPGRTITVNEAMTMALRAIGYTENSSLLVGVWPASYVSIAQNEGLYDDVAAKTTVDKANAAQIIYNLLTVQKVAVNADGATDFLWKNRAETIEANLLNTNLGCTEVEDEILGVNFDYDNSLINITGKIGAFGTAYKNDDGDLVAFTVESTALTGKVDGTKFKVGDTKYDFRTSTTDTAVFANTDLVDDAGFVEEELNAAKIQEVAEAYNDGNTVTINVDVSGKKIKEVYSVVAWKADNAALADADVQEDIEDGELLNKDFTLDDNDDIDMKSFQLVGVASLEDIAKDNVVYVYTNDANKIRKVAVGTEVLKDVEVDEKGSDFVTIDGKDYKFSKAMNAVDIATLDAGSEGDFYLDFDGKVFDFDGTTAVADNYAVIKDFENNEGSGFDDSRVRLYISDDASKTYYFADDADELDWVHNGTTIDAITTGALVGYSLDSDGNVDAFDTTAIEGSAYKIQSSKVMSITSSGVSTSYAIDANAVVFTYNTTTKTTASYDVANLSDLKAGTYAYDASIILDDGKVVAMFVHETSVDAKEDAVYGVFNTRTNAKTGDDDVYRFTGFIDGTAFSYKTDDRSGFNNLVGVFGVYKITIDANDVITAVAPLNDKFDPENSSGYVVKNAVIESLNSNKTVITDDNDDMWTIADDAVVYKYDKADKEFSVSKLSSLRPGYTVTLYDTKGKDADGIATVVIYFEKD